VKERAFRIPDNRKRNGRFGGRQTVRIVRAINHKSGVSPAKENDMKLNKLLSATALTVLMAGGASAETIGYSSPNFDDNFQTILREAAVVHIR
jgi:hypothetical protein